MTSELNPWKYVHVDPDRIKNNKYLTGGNNNSEGKENGDSGSSTGIISLDDVIKLTNIQCVNAKGNVFEQYSEILVAKSSVVDKDGKVLRFTPYEAASHFDENSGWLNSSAALLCNILVALYKAGVQKQQDGSYKTLNKGAKDLLDKYNGMWYTLNTIHNWLSKEDQKGILIHYPNAKDFGESNDVNTTRSRKKFEFDRTDFGDELLENMLKKPNFREYFINFSGLQNPEILVEIGRDYFKKSTKYWCPDNSQTAGRKSGSWLVCNSINFFINTINFLNYSYALLGVKVPEAPNK